jgi:hypothetical protein
MTGNARKMGWKWEIVDESFARGGDFSIVEWRAIKQKEGADE